MPYWFEPETVSLPLGDTTLTLETGRMAKQSAGSVVVTLGDTVVLVTVNTSKPRPGIDFFPLTVDFVEKTSAAGCPTWAAGSKALFRGDEMRDLESAEPGLFRGFQIPTSR